MPKYITIEEAAKVLDIPVGELRLAIDLKVINATKDKRLNEAEVRIFAVCTKLQMALTHIMQLSKKLSKSKQTEDTLNKLGYALKLVAEAAGEHVSPILKLYSVLH